MILLILMPQQGKRSKGAGEKKDKAGGKGGKGARRRKGMRGEKNGGKSGKKVGEKKSKRRKGGNKSRKERKLRRKGPGEKNVGAKCGRSSRAINETCITNILAMYAVYAGQMKNFEKQLKRIQAKNKTSKNKGGEQQIVF